MLFKMYVMIVLMSYFFCESSHFKRWRSILGSVIIATTFPTHYMAQAQIPMMDEFYVTSGTKIRDPKAKIEMKEMPVLDITQIKGTNMDRVNAIKGLIAAARWDDLREEIRFYKPICETYFGYNGIADIAEVLDMSKAQADKIENARADVAFQMKQLDDLAISSRAIYFNKEDLKQVENLYLEESSKSRENENISDASDIYSSFLSSFEDLVKIIDSK
jgi:hypothetical protein